MITYNGSTSAHISAAGDYTIDQDLTQSNPSAACITIAPGVNNVIIRLRSRIENTGGAASTNAGIQLSDNAACTIIGDGGSLRGFCYGIKADNSNLVRVQDIYIQDALFRGIYVIGDGAVITRNVVRNIHGATWVTNPYVMGIEVSGVSGNGYPTVTNNIVQNVNALASGFGESVGISFTDNCVGATCFGNVIKNNSKAGLPIAGGAQFGIWAGGNTALSCTHNLIDTWDYGVIASSLTGGFISHNAVSNCTNPISVASPNSWEIETI